MTGCATARMRFETSTALALEAAFDEGYKIGGMKEGLKSMRDTATEWCGEGYVPPAKV